MHSQRGTSPRGATNRGSNLPQRPVNNHTRLSGAVLLEADKEAFHGVDDRRSSPDV